MTTKQNDGSPAKEPDIVAEAGGLVDELHLTLGIHGPDLDPVEISTMLGCTPTATHRRGDARGARIPAWREGAWLLTVEGKAPTGPDDLVQALLSRVPDDPLLWERLAAKHAVRVTFGVFLGAWNRGLELSPSSVKRLARLGAPIGFDIYADPDEEHDQK